MDAKVHVRIFSERYHVVFSNGTNDLLSQQKKSKLSTFSRKYAVPKFMLQRIMTQSKFTHILENVVE